MSENNVDVDIDTMDDYSPEMIAHTIFIKDACSPCSHQILAYQEGTDMTYIYEILITILLEGLDIFTGGLKDTNLTDFDKTHITVLNPWFKSLGFNMNVHTLDISDKDSYKDYYCRTVINDKLNESLFIMKSMEHKSYHFFLNGQSLQQNKDKFYLKDIFGIFNNGDTTYRISFDFYIPSDDTTSNKLL